MPNFKLNPITGRLDISGVEASSIDHGALLGLGDNDHPQYVLTAGDTMTGTLTIEVPTATKNALILKTTDDDLTENILEIQNSSGAVLSNIDSLGNLWLKEGAETRYYDVGSSNYVGFEAPALTADQIWVLPDADGNSGEVLTTDGAGNLSWGVGSSLEAINNVNLIRNYPSLELADGAQPLWWIEAGGGTLTEEDAAGEGIPIIHNRVLKFEHSATPAGEILIQGFLEANSVITPTKQDKPEPTLEDATTKISTGAWVYTDDAGTLTFKLYDKDAEVEIDSVTTTTTGAWVYLKMENITFQDRTQIHFYHSAANATFYVAMPQLNVGEILLPWKSRGLIFKEKKADQIININPASVNWASYDSTSVVSDLTAFLYITSFTFNNGGGTGSSHIVRTGAAQDKLTYSLVGNTDVNSRRSITSKKIPVNDSQSFDYAVTSNTNLDILRISISGYYEWES